MLAEISDTIHFSPNYNHDGMDIVDTGIAGLVLGFLAYGLFLLFAATMLIRDGINRDAMYSDLVAERKKILKETYGCTDEDIKVLENEFIEKEGKKKVVKQDDAAISMVN